MTKVREVAHAIESKTLGEDGKGKERNRWILIDGVRVLRVTYPNSHSGDLKRGTLESIRKQLKLDPVRFQAFIKCTMSGPAYDEHLRQLKAEGML